MISVGGVPVIGGGTVAAADISDASATGRNVLTGGAAAGRDALGAVRRGGALADASALPTPTADLLGAQYLLTGGVDGLGVPLLATCVTDDGVAYSWGLVPFGADVAGLRTALSVYSAAETDAAITATVGGLLYKAACRAVATSNVASLSGTTTVDGVSLTAGQRVLLTAQSTAHQNGPWVVAAGAWSRPSPTELQACAAFPVTEGTTYHDTVWYLTTNDPITPGSTSVALSQLALNIPSTQISDSGTTGRDLLGAATPAAAAQALAGAPYSRTTTERLALSSPANGTTVYDSTVDRNFTRRGGLWIRDDGALLYGTQPGGDTSWPGVTLTQGPAGCSTAVSSGSVRWTQPANAVVGGGNTASVQIALAGIASSLAMRIEWRLVPVSGWSAATDLSYGAVATANFSQFWAARALGDRKVGVWTDRPGTDRQPGSTVTGVGPDASNTQVWLAMHFAGGRVLYQYGIGSAGSPPAAAAWITYAIYDLAADDGITTTSTLSGARSGETIFNLNVEGTVGAGSSRVVDLSALTIYPLGGWR